MKIPSEIVEEAKAFVESEIERGKSYDDDDTQRAFDIECDQRAMAGNMADWIIENAEKEDGSS